MTALGGDDSMLSIRECLGYVDERGNVEGETIRA